MLYLQIRRQPTHEQYSLPKIRWCIVRGLFVTRRMTVFPSSLVVEAKANPFAAMAPDNASVALFASSSSESAGL